MKVKYLFAFIIALFPLIINAQNYDNLWMEFNKNIDNRLPKSANEVLDIIEKQAVKDKNDVQLLKVIINRCEVISMTSEAPSDSIISYCKAKLPELSAASQVILKLELLSYENISEDADILQDSAILAETPMNRYSILFDTKNESVRANCEPTLYDYAMHKIIDYYAGFFYRETVDSLYEKLLAFDLENGFMQAYYNNKIRRIGDVSEKSDFDECAEIIETCNDTLIIVKAKMLQMNYLAHGIPDYVEALKICDEVMNLVDENSDYYRQCIDFQEAINTRTVGVGIQNVVLPNQPVPVSLEFRNTTNPSYKIIKVSSSEFRELHKYNNEENFQKLFVKEISAENTVKIPRETDYKKHSSLISLPPLEPGFYFLIFSNNDSFDNYNDLVFKSMQVSNIACIADDNGGSSDVFVVERASGLPVSNVTARFYKEIYSYKSNSYIQEDICMASCDKNGRVSFTGSGETVKMDLYNHGDTLISLSTIHHYTPLSTKEYNSTNFYTDRAIYRPGQTVQFKGVACQTNDSGKTILTAYETEVNLRDANGQIIESKTFTTDEYGSFNGVFVIPAGKMNGYFSIGDQHGSVNFKVEEYKRPTFEITFDTPKNEYKVGDEITIDGKISALSGFGLDHVKYTYSVTRYSAFPFRYWKNDNGYSDKKELLTGEGMSSGDGSFSIGFTLTPEHGLDVKSLPVFNYSVRVKATNAQGETQEASYQVLATYNRFFFNFSKNEADFSNVELKELTRVFATCVNTSGELVNADANLKIYKIKDRGKYSENIKSFDRKLLTDSILDADFPHFDYYNDFVNVMSEEKIANDSVNYSLVYQDVIKINGKQQLFPEQAGLDPGQYFFILKSVDDSLAVCMKKINVFDVKSGKLPGKEMLWCVVSRDTAQPGDVVNLYVGSSEEKASAMIFVKCGGKTIQTKRISLNDNIVTYKYKVTEEDRGGLLFEIVSIKYNTLNSADLNVSVPYNNLKLDIDVMSERDVFLPGEKITLKAKVKNHKRKGEKTSLMAGMYDSSLDRFYSKSWNLQAIPYKTEFSRFSDDGGFGIAFSNQQFYSYYFAIGNERLFSDFDLLPVVRKHGHGILYRMTNAAFEPDQIPSGNARDILETLSEESDEAIGATFANVRSNFNETAFFYPNLKTDENGDATFSFTMPDALTRWKLRMLAYTKDLKVGTLEKTFVTQKPVMIMADMPRFCYDEDTLWLVANVVNLSEETISPVAKLEVFEDVENNVTLNDIILSEKEIKMKEIPAGRSHVVRWKVAMKKDVNLLTFRFSATAGDFSDAEQHVMPVLSTEVFMTQTFSLIAKGNEKKNYNFDFEKEGERNHAITLNFSKNPTWYAVQALPYLDNENERYAETAFHRYFTNSVAKHVASSLKDSPEMKRLLESLENDTTNTTMSELEKNQELKEIILNETPWVMDAKNEAEQRANISKLFDTEVIDKNIESALKILEKKQKPSGGWPWVEGMPGSALVTQYILGGLGRIESLTNNKDVDTIAEKAFHFIENDVVKRFSDLKDSDKKNYHCGVMIVRELFVMSYFPKFETSARFKEAKAFYIGKLKKDWTNFNFEAQAGIALILNRNGDKTEAMAILKSLRECAQKNELGMYWVGVGVEDEARILEAFNEIDPKNEEIDAMRFWILGQKRTNMWDNDRATAEAVYAIVNRGTDWVNDNGEVVVEINDKRLEIRDESDNFIQQSLPVDGDYSNVSIDNQTNHQVWGGMFRQYFVPIDKVQKSNEDMKVRRELFVERIDGDKTKYVPVSEEDIKVGDKIKIVLYIENQQDMEFVYLKDLRGACFEPAEQVSRYHHSDGLWYYQSTSDVAMEFFFDAMPKGRHELSHTVYVTKEGSFSAGYAVVQCQYAPEFGAYSEGGRIVIK